MKIIANYITNAKRNFRCEIFNLRLMKQFGVNEKSSIAIEPRDPAILAKLSFK